MSYFDEQKISMANGCLNGRARTRNVVGRGRLKIVYDGLNCGEGGELRIEWWTWQLWTAE